MSEPIEKEMTEEEEMEMLNEFEQAMAVSELDNVEEERKCECGGYIFPIHEDNLHYGSYCTKCD